MNDRIGIWHEPESRNVRRSFEYAGSGEIHDTTPGGHPVIVHRGHPWFIAQIASTRVDSWFQNRLMGVLGSDNRDTTPTPSVYGVQMDRYELAKAVRRGQVTLFDGWVVIDTGAHYASGEPICRVVEQSV